MNRSRERIYQGQRTGGPARVTVDGLPLGFAGLDDSFEPIGFDWGQAGEGAEALALALVADHLGSVRAAVPHVRRIVEWVVATLPADWTLTGAAIEAALEAPSPRPSAGEEGDPLTSPLSPEGRG